MAEDSKRPAAQPPAEANPTGKAGKGFMKKLLLITGGIAAVAALVGGGVFVGMKMGGKATAAGEDVSVTQEVAADSGDHPAPPAAGQDGAKGGQAAAAGQSSGAAGKANRKDLTFTMSKIVTNLQDPNGQDLFQGTFHLEAATAGDRDILEDNEIPLRDAIISLLCGKTRDDVDQPADLERLKRELLARFEGIVEPGAIQKVYITDNIVLRN
jgi:flagellar basal body-associated protein FliL